MKAPVEAKRLDRHRDQAFRYWVEAADVERNVPAPEWVVIRAFRRLEVWQPGKFPKQPRVVLDLIDLPTSTTPCFSSQGASRSSPAGRRR